MAVSLETAVECLKDERLSRKSRFVDVLYRGCESWRNFAVTRASGATVIAAYDEETRRVMCLFHFGYVIVISSAAALSIGPHQ